MKFKVNHHPEITNYHAGLTINQASLPSTQGGYQITEEQIPDLSEICHKLFTTSIRNAGTGFNALQFVPILNEMKPIEQSEIDILIKNSKTNYVLIENQFLKIVLIHWLPGKIGSIHGHPKGGGISKVLYGSLEELRYTSDASPKLLSVSSYHKNSVGYIDDQLAYHSVGNPHKESAISMHVYTRK